MSLLWRKKPLRIALGLDRIMLWGGKSLELERAEDWRASLDALPELLKPHRNREANVVLADQFVRYTLLPWSEVLKTDEQWLALARHRFAVLHGAVAADWEVKLTATAPMGPRLGCAVDRQLIEALASIFVTAGVQLASVQPFLVAAFNRIRKTVGSGSCWIVVEETARLTLAFIQHGAWIAIRSRRSDERWRSVLPEILERESAFLGLSEPCTRVIVCAQGEFDVQMHDAFRAHALSYRELALAVEA
ncbi:MAG: hypothetical protein M3544_15925 [Pseudomonadota bacterium]|nr:hypothetical protein [Pseudomonadota bacterium]